MKKAAVGSLRDGEFVAGREAIAKINAIEGITLPSEVLHDFETFDAQNLSNEERRSLLIRKYGKAN